MRSRFFAKSVAGAAVGLLLAHCASIAGLDKYSTCASCGEAGPGVVPREDAAQGDDTSQVDPNDATVGAEDTGLGTELPPDATEGDDASGSDAPEPDGALEASLESGADVGSPVDGSAVEAGHDAGVDAAVDSGNSPKDAGGHDAALDAGSDAATCNAASCPNGCCTASGLCAGGGLTSACGMGGAACQNCASFSLVCSDNACVTQVPDSGSTGPPACMPSTCSNLCVPYFVQCCKSDQSCGCALLFPPGSCN